MDDKWRDKILNYIIEYIKENKATVIFISHDIPAIAQMCNRVVMLNKGQIKKDFLLTNDYEKNMSILEKETIYS
ncbi:hypothetical protein SHELI_v1c04880 [Spiroplasma helicoides]|uniref:ABC transporter ATP-binding protein n=1 Tax=Spiroplasma helicoides TaxID=216938 RepID=A0A1B3SKH7_9MOLU|nr:hypothetical protein [Spiroplasma helicoides]AOG60439.1 hypothetical protein SHELI_v1c04880 [Spiroplasma helicoides]